MASSSESGCSGPGRRRRAAEPHSISDGSRQQTGPVWCPATMCVPPRRSWTRPTNPRLRRARRMPGTPGAFTVAVRDVGWAGGVTSTGKLNVACPAVAPIELVMAVISTGLPSETVAVPISAQPLASRYRQPGTAHRGGQRRLRSSERDPWEIGPDHLAGAGHCVRERDDRQRPLWRGRARGSRRTRHGDYSGRRTLRAGWGRTTSRRLVAPPGYSW
jgi:hypothetical protein